MTDAMDSAALSAVRTLRVERAIEIGLLDHQHDAQQTEPAIERLLVRDVPIPEPTEEECSRYYALHPEQFSSGDLVFARHVLLAVTPGAPVARLREQAEKVLQEARAHPEQFARLAEQYSNCPSAQQGGHLGQLGRGDCVPEFEHALFDGRATGVLPRLVKTRFGFHVVAVDQRVPGQRVPFEAVRDQIAARLHERVQSKALTQYVRILAGQRGVEIPGLRSAGSPLVQ